MKIYFSPDCDRPNPYVNLKAANGIEYDCIATGLQGLVSLIELHLGIHFEPSTQIERLTGWMKCMRRVMNRGTNSLSKSWEKNALGVSNECLNWRDMLRLAKWTNAMEQPDDRFRIIAEADQQYDMPSTADRIIGLLALIDRNPFEPDTAIHVGATSPVALLPLVAELLEKLAGHGVKVVYDTDRIAAAPGSNLAKVQALLCSGKADDSLGDGADDDSFAVWEFDTATDACRYIASLPADAFDLYVLSDGKLLDNTQQMLGQPTSGTSRANSAPQIAQMFLLGMNLFEYPLNINSLLAWLQLPLHPIKSELRHALVKVIVETTGFDNDRYHEAIARYLESLPDDEEREKAERTLDIFDVRPSEKVDMEQLRKFNTALGTWASQMSAIDDVEESKRQQFYVVSTLCSTLASLLEDIDEKEIPYRRLEAAISTLYNGAEFRIYDSQAGARFTTDCSGIVSETDRIAWTDCYNYTPGHTPYEFLNDDERRHFTAQGCTLQSADDFNRAAIRQLTMPVLKATERCVIVTVKRSVGVDTTPHPIMIQLTEGFKTSLPRVVLRPSLEPFETKEVEPVDNYTNTDRIKVKCPLPMPDHESYSSLSKLIQYPLDYVLENIARIYTNASTDLKRLQTIKGDVAHKVIETLFEGTADEIAAKIASDYDSTLSLVIEQEGAVMLLPEHELECKRYRSELRECLDTLVGIIRANNLTVASREQEIYTHIGLLSGEADPGMKGFIDMVLTDSAGSLYIFDFKWTDSRRHYREILEKNTALQLALYKKMLHLAEGCEIKACAYFTMPRHEMYTTSEHLTGAGVVHVTPRNNDDIVQQAIDSYRYRRQRLENGIIDNEEGREIKGLDYSEAIADGANLFPLEPDYNDENLHAYNRFSNYGCFKQ